MCIVTLNSTDNISETNTMTQPENKSFPSMQDSVELHAARICGHMNSDHADAVAHLAMYHARLNVLPVWTNMDKISRTSMSISYKTADSDSVHAAVIALEPPIESVMDSRVRLVEMSKRAEEANNALLRRAGMSIDSEAVITTVYAFSVNPAVAALTVFAFVSIACPISVQRTLSPGDDVTESSFKLHFARLLCAVAVFLDRHTTCTLIFLLPLCLVQAFALLSWLSHRWRNAPPVDVSVEWLGSLLMNPLPPLDDLGWRAQVVVVTGGSQGLGGELALKLAQKGAKVVSLDVSKASVGHENIASYVCDVSKYANVAAVAKSIVTTHGPPTVLINNCGVRNGGTITDVSAEEIEGLVDTNLLSSFWTLKAFLPTMIERGRGHIITVASVFGYAGVAQLTDYVASKHALIGMHESLRFELDAIHKKPFVRTTLVCPGHMRDTRMFANVQYNDAARVLAPSTTKDAIAARVVEAIRLQESTVIQAPAFVAWSPVLRLLPSFLRDGVQKLLGANESLPAHV